MTTLLIAASKTSNLSKCNSVLTSLLLLTPVSQLILCTLLAEYYIELPQSTKAVTGGNNQAYNLTTWQGTANLKGMSCNEVKTDILDITLQDGPVDLQPAAFGLTAARTDGLVLNSVVDSKIIKLAYLTI